MGSFALVGGPSNPGLATVGSCKFYKVDSLAVATRISHKYQVLLDDGNRIIIPQGNFKILTFPFVYSGQYFMLKLYAVVLAPKPPPPPKRKRDSMGQENGRRYKRRKKEKSKNWVLNTIHCVFNRTLQFNTSNLMH